MCVHKKKNTRMRGSRSITRSTRWINALINDPSYYEDGQRANSSIASIFRKRESRPRPDHSVRRILRDDLEELRACRCTIKSTIVPEQCHYVADLFIFSLFLRFTAAWWLRSFPFRWMSAPLRFRIWERWTNWRCSTAMAFKWSNINLVCLILWILL